MPERYVVTRAVCGNKRAISNISISFFLQVPILQKYSRIFFEYLSCEIYFFTAINTVLYQKCLQK